MFATTQWGLALLIICERCSESKIIFFLQNTKSIWTITIRLFVLHIDPWQSHQSEILCIGCTCENKQKHSHGWMKMCRCYEMIYAETLMRYKNLSLGVSACSWKRYSQSWGRPASGWAPHWSLGPTADLQLSTPQPRSRKSAKRVTLKIIWHVMVKRRSYGSIWQSSFVSLRPFVCLFHTTEALTPRRIKTISFLLLSVVVSSFIIVYLYIYLYIWGHDQDFGDWDVGPVMFLVSLRNGRRRPYGIFKWDM